MSECVHPLILQNSIKLGHKYFINPMVPLKLPPRTIKEYEERCEHEVSFPYVGMKTEMNGKPVDIVYVQKIDGIPIISKLERRTNGD